MKVKPFEMSATPKKRAEVVTLTASEAAFVLDALKEQENDQLRIAEIQAMQAEMLASVPSPKKLERSPTIHPSRASTPIRGSSATAKKTQKPVLLSDYLTPKHTGRAKKKPRSCPPMPPAPRLRPLPSPATPLEVLKLIEQDKKMVREMTGEGSPDRKPPAVTHSVVTVVDGVKTMEIIDLTGDTPDRVTKQPDDVVVTIDGIALSMNEVLGE